MSTNIFQIFKALALSVVISLVFVLVFTLIMQLCNLPIDCVKPINQVVKILAIAAGGLIFIRGEKGLIKGAIYGLLAVVATYFLFSLISLSINFTWKFAFEILLGIVAGSISGIIGVNIKHNA